MDQDLVIRAQQGDQRAFDALTIANHSRLYRLAYGILRDHHLAEDATQQAFLDIWRHLPRLRDTSKFEGWSYRLLVNACYDESKHQPKSAPDAETRPVIQPVAPDAISQVIDRDQLERALQRLSPDHRAVLVLRFLLDMSPAEVAETLGVSRWTVYSRLERASQSIRAVLGAESRPAESAPDLEEVVR
jgi:RNA polymerase sigma-70 factor (ECF subfamily)